METISDLNIGDEVVITGYNAGNNAYRKKLMALGLTEGTRMKIIRQAPLGDPIEVQVRGFLLSLRNDDTSVLKFNKG